MEKLDLKNIDKSNWKTYRFEEIANKVTENINPSTTELKVYVGLEHIDAEDIHIKRFGVPSDVKGGKLRCYPGDVLFGKRRAYQRKAAIVNFDGICSAHAFVFRAIQEVIEPNILPFFLHSDQFMHRMVDISVGGLSPTINWGDLKGQEFLLPPKEQQAQLAELLWAMDEVIERGLRRKNKLEVLMKVELKRLLSTGIGHKEFKSSKLGVIPKTWEYTNFESVISFMKSGLSRKIVSEDIGIPVLISGNIQQGRLDLTDLKYWYLNDPQGSNVSNYILKTGDILLCFINSLSQIGKCCQFKDIGRDAIYTTNLFRIVPNDKIYNVFLYYLLLSDYAQRKIKQITMPAVNQASFTKVDFLRIKFPLPPINEQKLIVERLSLIDSQKEDLEAHEIASKALQKSLINQIF